MLINGVQLSTLGAQLHDRTFTSNQIDTSEDWNEGSTQPTFIRQQITFKDITLQFLITEQNEEDAFIVMSNLTMLLKKATIIFDDMPNLQFDVVMQDQGKQERLKNGNFLYTVSLKNDYAKGQSEIYTTNTAATDSFKLTLAYYKDSTTLIATETVVIKASSFSGDKVISLGDLGIRLNKYQEDYYNNGVVTNFSGVTLSYANLYSLGTMIINYSPIVYSKPVGYYLNDGQGGYRLVEETVTNFTYFDYQKMTTMGQLVNLNRNRPSGYRAKVTPDELLSFNDLMNLNGSINVYFDVIQNEQSKNVTVNYYKENDDSSTTLIESQTVIIRESDIVDGDTLSDVININGKKPNNYYENGTCIEIDLESLIRFDSLLDTYNIYYNKTKALVYVEYYYGTYPGWNRVATDTCQIRYLDTFEDSDNIINTLGIDINKYKNDYYENGLIFNDGIYTNFDSVINVGVIQVYYTPKEYNITVKYMQDNEDGESLVELGTKSYTLTDLMFVSNPRLSQLINVNQFRPDGFAFSEEDSYRGEISIPALTQASPITIVYKSVGVVNTKSIVIKYKKQLSSTFSTINTSVITIEEAEVGGGVRLRDIFDVNKYKPDYYENGIIDGYSQEAIFTFDEIQGTYDVYYFATSYSTQVRYYTDEVAAENWIGSNSINYTLLDFESDTTVVSLGLDINAYKPSYCDDGEVQYFGATTFTNLIGLDAINIVYKSIKEPEEDDGINYPHRILFLQHNDMGQYDNSFPTWTLNHAYINTGVTCLDMSKLTVAMSTVRVFEDQPLYNVNVGDRYLFGAMSPNGNYYIKYQNNTTYTDNPTGHNYFIAAAGKDTPILQIEEESNNGFSRNTGIYASERAGYSYATLTYSNLIQTNSAQMLIPLYLFACNDRGNYLGGIAGVGITSCKIYYDGVLLRDFVPVQYYDLIGTKIAPSNCLYDKVTQTFFEDATGKNSFNIMDDDMYEDDDPVHNIGKCYCNYYKGGDFFQTRVIYFRESEFINGNVWDPVEKLGIENYQPDFCGEGVITNLNELGGITFNNLKDFVFEVNYPSEAYHIIVNYYKDNDDVENLISSDRVELVENMFYSVPTFGMLVDLLKYKPEGYGLRQEDIPYKDDKVTLRRVLKNYEYKVIYTPWENPQTKTITVKYYKHRNWIEPKNPLNQYTFIGEREITIDETQVIDGVYPEIFMSFNAYKPANELDYWYDGVPFEWYKQDENLLGLDKLKDEYIIVYEPRTMYININYYTDEVDDANLIASSTWGIRINDWDFDYRFQIVDELPNIFFDKYQPANCYPGVLQESDKYYTFDSLVKQGHLDIVFTSKIEPHDPEDDSFPNKVLWYYPDKNRFTISDGMSGKGSANSRRWHLHNGGCYTNPGMGPYIPYLDLGYTPKEIQRLRMQTKFYSLGASMSTGGRKYAPDTLDTMGMLGYAGPMSRSSLSSNIGKEDAEARIFGSGTGQYYDLYSKNSPESTGYFFVRGHCPHGGFGGSSRRASRNLWGGVVNVDNNEGMKWSNTQQTQVTSDDIYHSCYKGVTAGFRLGKYASYDEDLNHFKENDDHIYKVEVGDHKGHTAKSFSNALSEIWRSDIHNFEYPDDMDAIENSGSAAVNNLTNSDELEAPWRDFNPSTFFHPYTVTLDAYNNYCEIYDMTNSEDPYHWNINTQNDLNLFADRCKPKGSITLFVTTNPDTGQVNIVPDGYLLRPYTVNFNETIEGYSDSRPGQTSEGEGSGGQSAPGTTTGGSTSGSTGGGGSQSQLEIYGGLLNMAYNPYTVSGINCPWGNGRSDAFPVPMRTAVWGVKIWDRDRLVRNLIPVAKGDQVYDYVMPENGMFDLVTEIFFGNVNKGGNYGTVNKGEEQSRVVTVGADEVFTLRVNDDPTSYGKIVVNYYDYDNSFIGNQWVEVPCDYFYTNISFKDVLKYNDMKPSPFYHDGMIDTDVDIEDDIPNRNKLKKIFDKGTMNVYYKQKQYTKTVVYYYGNSRIGSKDFFFSQAEIEAANTLEDLGIDKDLYLTDEFKPGVIMADESIIASDDVAAFINAPSPIVVYDKWTKEERPDLFYYEYYRGGAYEPEGEETITLNSDNKNYLDCDLVAACLNPNGAIKYVDHYHDALYEDEKQSYFISYQVDVNVNYCEVHKGPARGYKLLAEITDRGRYTVVEENRGWGRLKEYPKGWVLLANTRTVTGPGQNPDYDKGGNLPKVIVPFGTKFSITKMTIDRLWAYAPEFDSWIKTEEISFDQSGRLYNALSTGVIHLDQIDWENINSLSDLNIDPQRFKLRFHEDSDYVYNGEFTEEAFSELHSIDFVYPETIYTYPVKYYKDTLDTSNLVGSGAFSCTISDWNPDWDTFLATSWKTGRRANVSATGTFHQVSGITKDYNLHEENIGDEVWILRSDTTIKDNIECYYCLWNGMIGYMPTASVTIVDNVIRSVSPVLYRTGIPIRLSWAYYGLDRNLYKPGPEYNDGMFLWNPQTYNNNNLTFSFEEIIITTKQTVLYTPVMDIGYKAKYTMSWSQLPINITNFVPNPDYNDNAAGLWDIEIKYQPEVTDSTYPDQDKHNRQMFSIGENIKPHTRIQNNVGSYYDIYSDGIAGPVIDRHSEYQKRTVGIYHFYMTGSTDHYNAYYEPDEYIDSTTIGSFYNIINFSNKRPADLAIAQLTGNDLTKWESTSPRFGSRQGPSTPIDMEYLNVGNGVYYYHNYYGQYEDLGDTHHYLKSVGSNIVYYVKVWKNYYLEHYFVPLPEGYWLPDGRRMSQSGFYDIITKQICGMSPLKYDSSTPFEYSKPSIYKLHSPATGKPYDYFEEWTYETENVNYLVETTGITMAFKHPDTASEQLDTIEKGTVIPVTKMTDDSAHRVVGTWYWTGKYWIRASETKMLLPNAYDIRAYNKTLMLKGDTSNTASTYYSYRRPSTYVPDYLEYTKVIDSNGAVLLEDTGVDSRNLGRIEIDFTYLDNYYQRDVTESYAKTSDGNYTAGYLFGAGNYEPKLIINPVTHSLGSFTFEKGTRHTVVMDAVLTNENGYGTKYAYIVDGNVVGYSNTYNRNSSNFANIRLNGNLTKGYSVSNGRAGVCAEFYNIKIWNTNGNLIFDLKPVGKIENKYPVFKLYNAVSGTYFDINANAMSYDATDEVKNWTHPQNSNTVFTVEELDNIYAASGDFYWNGKMWIPSSYTTDYVIEFDSPKRYIVNSTLPYYIWPKLADSVQSGNYLLGDRINAVLALGKDPKWLKLSSGYWVFNNEQLEEIE